MKNKIIYILAIVLSLIYIFIGNRIAMKDNHFLENNKEDGVYEKAKVIKILEKSDSKEQVEGLEDLDTSEIKFRAKFLRGNRKGEMTTAIQSLTPYMNKTVQEIKEGDEVILLEQQIDDDGSKVWYFVQFERIDSLIVLGIIFIGLLILFGKFKGINTIVSLIFTCLSIFIVFVPAILGGQNIYVWSIITCVFITIMTVIIVNGANKKSISTMLGCVGGVCVAGILTVIMDGIMKLTGFIDDNSIYLLYLNEENPIDIKAIIFGGIIIGAVGAIMDVAIDISSSLKEVASKMEKPDFASILKSGFTIGKDIMGTMTNTLILAYIGSSMAEVLLLIAQNGSLNILLNREMIIVEILQALVGSIGILFAIPLTSIIAAILYQHEDMKEEKQIRKYFRRKKSE